MKKVFALIAISLFFFAGCSQENSEISDKQASYDPNPTESSITPDVSEKTGYYLDEYVEIFPEYIFQGKSEETSDDRHFSLKALPQNIPEELVANHYYYDIAGEFEKLSNIYGENEALKISVTNTKEDFNQGAYIKEYIVKTLSVLPKDELESATSAIAFSLEKDVQSFNLTAFTVIKAEISMLHSQESLDRGPQLGDGDYVFSFLCGKSEHIGEWKIYEVYWE